MRILSGIRWLGRFGPTHCWWLRSHLGRTRLLAIRETLGVAFRSDARELRQLIADTFMEKS
jgi:hypothetical protein